MNLSFERLIVEELCELGYRGLRAADGPSGLAILQSSQHIDLLVTDICLLSLIERQVVDAARQVGLPSKSCS